MFLGLVLLAVLGGALYSLGPRPPVDTAVDFDPERLPADLDAWLSGSEAEFPDIRPGNRKQIVWADPASHARTPLAIVYIHGFSAGPAEIRPLPDEVARTLGANLFFTRLAGHGRGGDAMLSGSVRAWANDLAEALAIGRRLGEKVVVIATSTGATLASWGLSQAELSRDVAGFVAVSPNYGVRAAGGFLLSGPWASQIIRLLLGERRSFEPRNAAHAANWTIDYPAQSLVALGGLLRLADRLDYARIRTPALFVFSPGDRVVRPDLTRAVAARWGGPAETIEVLRSGDRENHVIAGDALSPQTTAALSAQIVDWIRSLPR